MVVELQRGVWCVVWGVRCGEWVAGCGVWGVVLWGLGLRVWGVGGGTCTKASRAARMVVMVETRSPFGGSVLTPASTYVRVQGSGLICICVYIHMYVCKSIYRQIDR